MRKERSIYYRGSLLTARNTAPREWTVELDGLGVFYTARTLAEAMRQAKEEVSAGELGAD